MNDTPIYPNWFESQKHNFETHLTRFKGEPNLRFLQIGAYKGDATEWLMDNILTDKSSHLIDVDTWEGSDEEQHKLINFDWVHQHYLLRIARFENVSFFKAKSEHVLPNLNHKFNFIYIDGDHTEKAVYKDAIQSWELVVSGGIVAFDDYLWGEELEPHLRPKPAIDRFLAEKQDEYEILEKGYQVWILKK